MYTSGFNTAVDLTSHFGDHGADFGASNEVQYERLADDFCGAPLPSGALECRRRNGDIVRYNPMTDEFGVLSRLGVVRTYYKPNPVVHGCLTNEDYFHQTCKR